MARDIRALASALKSQDSAAQQAAAEELAQLGDGAQPAAVALVEALAAGDEVREQVSAALEELGPPSASDTGALAALLKRPQLDVAYWAATLLGRLGAKAGSAVAPLTSALQSHPELSVRQRAAWALGVIGPAAAAAQPALEAAAKDSDRRLAALAKEALAAVGGKA